MPGVTTFVKWLRRGVQALSVLYPFSLLCVALALRYVGEAWWVSIVALYLPRVGFALPLPFLVIALVRLRSRRLLALQAASALLVVFPLMGFVLPTPTFASRDQPTIRVLSFNVNSGDDGPRAVVDEIERHSPDIVLLQETSGNEELATLLQSRYPTVQATGEFLMATRYAISPEADPQATPASSSHFQRLALETPLGRIVVYSVHTVSPRAQLFALRGRRRLFSVLRGSGGPALEANAARRTAEVEKFAAAASHETGTVIMAGDTNLPGLSPVFHRYLSGYQDGFSSAGWGFGYTFPTNKWRPWMRIDRILATERLRFVHFEVGADRAASDHLCVVADIQQR